MVEALTLERLLTGSAGFGLTTASPLQRACCRIIDGLPLGELAAYDEVRAAVGDVGALPVGVRPAQVDILSGIRTGKSLLAAATAVLATQICDLSALGPGEVPRVAVVSLTTDLGRVVFGHVVGNLTARPRLRALIVEPPTVDSILVRHPTGRPVEIKVVAGARAGASLVARWSAGCIFDEKPRMVGSEDGAVVNFDDCRDAVVGRLLLGAQIISIGTPWSPWGPAVRAVEEHWGRPTPHHVIIRAPAPAMNPVWWTRERVAYVQANEPRVYRTDVLGEFAAPEASAFDARAVDLSMGRTPDGRDLAERVGLIDLSSGKSDGLAFGVGGWSAQDRWLRDVEGQIRHYPWGDPMPRKLDRELAPMFVVDAVDVREGNFWAQMPADEMYDIMASFFRKHGVRHVHGDQRESYSARSAFERRGFVFHEHVWSNPSKIRAIELLRRWFAPPGLICLPKDERLRRQLISYREKITASGGIVFQGRGQTRDDLAALLVTAALAELETGLPRSPHRPSAARGMGKRPLLAFN